MKLAYFFVSSPSNVSVEILSFVATTVNSRYNALLGPAGKVCYIEGMPKAIAKEVWTFELVRYLV